MKSHKQMKSMQFAQEPLKRKTREIFKEYLSFIYYDNIDFPKNVEIKPFNGYQTREYNFGELTIPNEVNEAYVLNLEQSTIATISKEILYHEFTHMMDYVVNNKHIAFKDRLHNLHFLSEVRATYIEYLIRSNFKSTKDNKTLNNNSIVLSSRVFTSILLADEIKKYNDQIIKDINNISYDNFLSVINQIYYYIGFIVFVEKHSDTVIDYTPVIQKLSPLLGDTIQNLFEIRNTIPLNFEPIEQELFYNIGNIENSIYQYYKKHLSD